MKVSPVMHTLHYIETNKPVHSSFLTYHLLLSQRLCCSMFNFIRCILWIILSFWHCMDWKLILIWKNRHTYLIVTYMEGKIRIYRAPKGRGSTNIYMGFGPVYISIPVCIAEHWRSRRECMFKQLNVCFLFWYAINKDSR